MRDLGPWAAAGVCIGALTLASGRGHAQEVSSDELYSQGATALEKGDHDRAIAAFEALADRGVLKPGATYNRGLAYVTRVRDKAERPGDLGRAAAAFEEALLLNPDDTDAEQALDLVRAEVARRRARRGGAAEVQARPSLDRLVVGLAPEHVWAWGALVSSAVLTAGLVLRKAARGPKHIAGLIATPVGLVLLLSLGSLTAHARNLRHTTKPAVIVVPEAHVLDENGAATGRDPVPEAACVEVRDQRGTLVRIRYGTDEGWTHGASVRLIGPTQ